MKKEDCKLVEKIIRHTASFKVHNIAYALTENNVTVWSTLNRTDVFYATEIIPLFTELFRMYVTYNIDKYKCVLVIF